MVDFSEMTARLRSYKLVKRLAAMTMDGEEIEGKEFIMENDDAIAVLNNLIADARNIIDGQEG